MKAPDLGGFAGIPMTRIEARALLDAAREGAAVSRDWITQALRVTGDLAGPKVGLVWEVAGWRATHGDRANRGTDEWRVSNGLH